MLFVAYWIASLGAWAVFMALWWGAALTFGFAPPTQDQIAGCGWLIMGASQVAAVITIGLLFYAERCEQRR